MLRFVHSEIVYYKKKNKLLIKRTIICTLFFFNVFNYIIKNIKADP